MNEGNSAPLYNPIAPLFQFMNGLVVFLCHLSRCRLVRMPSLSCVAVLVPVYDEVFPLCLGICVLGSVISVLEILIVCS